MVQYLNPNFCAKDSFSCDPISKKLNSKQDETHANFFPFVDGISADLTCGSFLHIQLWNILSLASVKEEGCNGTMEERGSLRRY